MLGFTFALSFLLLAPAVLTAQSADVSTLRTDVRLTTVDVVVTDGSGNPIRGLKQDDFTVKEAKKPQKINGFEEHTASTTPIAYDPPRPGVFTNATAARGSVNAVMLIDFLNTPAADQSYMRNQLVKFILMQQPGTRTAIFVMSSSVHMLQDFTADPGVLKTALLRLGTKFSPLINTADLRNDSEVQAYVNRMAQMQASGDGAGAALMAQLLQALNDSTTREQTMTMRNQVLLTLSDLTDVARNLAGVPGRKNVYWLSPAFHSFLSRDIFSNGRPFVGDVDIGPELQDAINALATAQVALYPVSTRALAPGPLLAEQQNYSTDLTLRRAANSSDSFSSETDAFQKQQWQEQATMNDLADGTGGKAYYNRNDLAQALQEAHRDGTNFYTLSYTPPTDAKPGQYREIRVETRIKGAHLSYRRGYYATAPSNGNPLPLNSQRTARAMQAGAPQSSEVLFQVEVSRPSQQTAQAKVIGGPVFDGLPHGTYQLNAVVDFATLQFSPGWDGKMHGVVDVATVVYAKDGKVLDSRMDRATLALDEARYQAMRKGGLKYHQVVAVPDKGDGYVRMAVHDASTDKLGTVQMAMSAIRSSATPSQP